jgi:hypothetical protein
MANSDMSTNESGVSIRIKGLDEFQAKLKTVERKAPDRILDKLDAEGKELKKAVRKNTPKRTGKLKKSWKLAPVEKIQGGYQKGLYSKDPKFPLVEKGHRKVTQSGKEIGWTPGKFFLEKTVKEREEETAEELDKWLDELFKELK